MTGRIIFLDWITRDMVRAEPEARFVFGDNVQRVGLGGQAGRGRVMLRNLGFAIILGVCGAVFVAGILFAVSAI